MTATTIPAPGSDIQGRELDAAVAEKVLGWFWVRWSDELLEVESRNPDPSARPADPKAIMCRPDDWHKTFEAETIGAWDGEKHHEVRMWQLAAPDDPRLLSLLPDFNIPRFSSDISAAWQIVEAVCAKSKWYALCYRPTGAACNFMGDTHSEVLATFEECGGSRAKAQALAICRAALRFAESLT